MSNVSSAHGFQGYTRAEMEATTAITRSQDPRWRWLFPVTKGSRDYIRSQFALLNGSYAVAMALIYLAATADNALSDGTMGWWLSEGTVSILARNLLYVPLVKASPVEVARRSALRLLPLVAVTLGVAHWAWTAWLYVGPGLQLTTVVVLLVFVMLSIASIAIAPASPISCILYLSVVWSAMGWQLAHTEWLGAGTMAVLIAALVGILWLAFHIVVSNSRRYLLQSDEMELLVEDLRSQNDEVDRLRRQAADQLEQRSCFFASASHDFRQRVHALKLLAASPVAGDTRASELLRSSLDRVSEVTEDLEDYMTHVLEFARLDGHAIVPTIRLIALQDILQRIELRFEDIVAERNVELRVRATRLKAWTDPAMLERILENIVSNAVKFTRDRVLVTVRRLSGSIHIDVRDHGPGIPNEAIGRIFDAFFQAHDGDSNPQRGVGLGMAIVKRLADSLGYDVVIRSRLGEGTLARIVIPASERPTPEE